jgi:hypothetical protein
MKLFLCDRTRFRRYFTFFKLDVRIVGDEYRKRISQDARTVRKGIEFFGAGSPFFKQ